MCLKFSMGFPGSSAGKEPCNAGENESESGSVVSDSLWLHGLYSLWNSPNQNTGVGSQFPSPGDLPKPGVETKSPTLQADSLPAEPQGKPKNTGVGSLSLLQWIFPTQELNQGLLHCRQILYQLSYQGSPGDFSSTPGLGGSPGERMGYPLQYSWVSLVAQTVKNLPAMRET